MKNKSIANRYEDFFSKIVCVIILYKSPFESSKAFSSLTQAAKAVNEKILIDLIVYDNSPDPIDYTTKKNSCWNIKYIHDKSNPGLSKASNVGYQLASQMNKNWILFVNPDTEFSQDYFIKLIDAVFANPTYDLFVPILISNRHIVSPSKYILMRGSFSNKVEVGANNFKKKSLLFSGMFISLKSFEKVGGFNNKIRLDFMDSFFFDKFKRHFPTFYLLDTYCNHDLSSFESDKAKTKIRHIYFCDGAQNAVEKFHEYILIGIICFARSIKLSFIFKDIYFVKIFLLYFLFKKGM